MPDNDKAIIRYLVACKLPAMGQKTIEKIVNKFKDKTFDILDKDMNQLTNIKGISEKKLIPIKEKWHQISSERQTHLFLHELNIGNSLIHKIYQFHQDKPLRMLVKILTTYVKILTG